jgi:quinol-cytochrome oxidoreductase complex cytochrome b subunit
MASLVITRPSKIYPNWYFLVWKYKNLATLSSHPNLSVNHLDSIMRIKLWITRIMRKLATLFCFVVKLGSQRNRCYDF